MNEPNQKKQVEVVAAIIEQDGKVLCMQRGRNKLPYISLKWEFPGGKIELGESESGALKREIREELDASIEVGRKVMTVVHEYPDFILKMPDSCMRCQIRTLWRARALAPPHLREMPETSPHTPL